MITETIIQEGQILTGPQFNEPMLVETVRSNGPGTWIVGLRRPAIAKTDAREGEPPVQCPVVGFTEVTYG